jgi:chromosome segregation ATPase
MANMRRSEPKGVSAEARAQWAEREVERLRAEWRKADDGWIACRQQLQGAVERAERAERYVAEYEQTIRDLNAECQRLRALTHPGGQ